MKFHKIPRNKRNTFTYEAFIKQYGYSPYHKDVEDAVKERFPKNWTESLKKLQESNETALLKMKPCGLKMKLSIKAVVFTHIRTTILIELLSFYFCLYLSLFRTSHYM